MYEAPRKAQPLSYHFQFQKGFWKYGLLNIKCLCLLQQGCFIQCIATFQEIKRVGIIKIIHLFL